MLIVNIIAILNVFIIFILLFFRRENALPNKILAIAFLIPGLYFVNNILILAEVDKWISFSLFLVQMIAVLFPVMIYYYFNLLLGKGFQGNRILFSGSLLLFLYITILAIRFFLFTDIEKTDYIARLSRDDYPLDLFLYTVVFYAWQLVYFSVITWKIVKYKRQLDANLSNIDKVQFYYLVRFILTLWIFNALLVTFYILLPLYIVDYLMLPIVVNALYFFILYFTYHHNAVFTSITFNKLTEANEELTNEEVETFLEKKIFIPTEKHEEVYKTITELLIKDHIYKNADLSIKSISAQIGEAEYIVSQSINHYYQKSFFELINESRINAAKQRLKEMLSSETIEGISYDIGFNSRSSFYRAFKKYTGESPQQYIKSSE